jgi:hypothetical protein
MCALENLSTAKSLRFTACFARQTKAFLDKDLPLRSADFTKIVLPCLKSLPKRLADTIDRCAIDETNDKLFLKYERMTNSSGIKFTPWITVNGKYRVRDDAEIRQDLLGYLCRRTSKQKRLDYCPERYHSLKRIESVRNLGKTSSRVQAILDSSSMGGCPRDGCGKGCSEGCGTQHKLKLTNEED